MADETTLATDAAEQDDAAAAVVTQAEIDDVLDDPTLSTGEKQARLEELRERILDREHAEHDEDYMPFETRIMDALSMLAEGGHDYGAADQATPDEADDRPV